MKMKNRTKRITEEDLKLMLKNKNIKISEETTFKHNLLDIKTTEKKQENSVSKAIKSLKHCDIKIDSGIEDGQNYICFWFEGARLLTLNEMLSSIQSSSKYELFKYKKEWQCLIERSLLLLGKKNKHFFDTECSFTLFRQGVKLIDLDGFQAAFKYAIDALCYKKILSEDNPNIMHETISVQSKGKIYICGIKIKTLNKPKENHYGATDIYNEWFKK